MIQRFDLETKNLEDALRDSVDLKLRAFRKSGAIGDLIRLRDTRVEAGVRLADEVASAFVTTPTADGHDVLAAGKAVLPELDIQRANPGAVQALLQAHGCLLLRDAMPVRQTLVFLQLFDAALQAADELRQIEDQGRKDDRHTDSKEMFHRPRILAEMPSVDEGPDLVEQGALLTFMSPRISFEWLDFLTRVGLRRVCQSCLQDEVCLTFDDSVIRRLQPEPEIPTGPSSTRTKRGTLRLWMPLYDCGADTDRLGLEIAPSHNGLGASPFFAAGDALLMNEKCIFSMACGSNFTQDSVAIETVFLSGSKAASVRRPVFW